MKQLKISCSGITRKSCEQQIRLVNPLPGKPLGSSALRYMIETGRETGVITMESAHYIIRKSSLLN